MPKNIESGLEKEATEIEEEEPSELLIEPWKSEDKVMTPLGSERPDFSVRYRGTTYPLFVRDFKKYPHVEYCDKTYAWYFPGEKERMPPHIWMDASVPKEYWEIVLVHECAEAEGHRKEEVDSRQRHRQAMKAETEFARQHLNESEFRDYLRWKKEQFKEAFSERIEERKARRNIKIP